MTDLADATARWSAKSLGLRLRRSWHVAGRRAALVSVAAHSGGSQRALQSRSSRQRPLVDGQAEEGGGPPKEGSGDYPGDTSDVNFPKYDQGINAMIDQCKKPKEIKEKAMSGEDTRRAKEVNLHMLSEYEKCVEKIHALAHLVQEGGDYSREQNKDYTEKAIQFLQELAFIEDYTKSFRNINGDLVTATKYLLKESIKVTKYLNDLVDRGDPVELAKPAHDPWA